MRAVRRKSWIAALGVAALLTLAWPGPTYAQTALGGYSGVARADAIHVEVFDPTLPLPSDPQLDFGIAHTKSNTDTGPASRALASYLWPGDVIGDGFDQLTGTPGSTYPVQINSRYPATSDSPARAVAQVSGGNGMTTSSDDTTTRATASGLGVSGDALNDPGQGLCQILTPNPSSCPKPPAAPKVPVAVSRQVSALVTMSGGTSESVVTVGEHSVTSTAHATGSGLKLLGGLITIGNVDITSTTVSDGKKAVVTGTSDISSVTVAGTKLGFDAKGLDLAGTAIKIPAVPATVTDLLKQIGISFDYAPTSSSISGATGSLSASGLVITVDTKLLHDSLAPLTGLLADLLNKVPNLDQVTALLGLGPRIRFIIGDVSASATAAPAYVGSTTPTGGGTTSGSTGGTTSGVGGPAGESPGGAGALGTSGLGGGAAPPVNQAAPELNPAAAAPGASRPVAFTYPTLGQVPRLLVLGALALAAAIGWLFRGAGGFILGGGRTCVHGLRTGLPDLRKGEV